MNVSKCSEWNGRVNELGKMNGGLKAEDERLPCSEIRTPRFSLRHSDRACRARRACLAHHLRTINEEGGFFERIEQPLGNFQAASAHTHFDVRFGDAVKIASTGHQQV